MLFITPSTLLDRPDPLPPRTESTLPVVVATTSSLLALALTTYVLRIWVRSKGVFLLGGDDATITLAILLTLACWAINLYVAIVTGGRHTYYIELEDLARVARASYVLVFLWLWSVTMVKVSVCIMLLRIKSRSRPWLIGLWTLIVILIALACAITVCYLMMCDPIEANWDFKYLLQPGHCWTLDQFLHFTYTFSSVFVLTDVICAILPVAFIWRIKRPLREKITLCILMGLGLLAAFCGIMKIVMLKRTLLSPDPVYEAASAQIWALSEAFVGIFAANIPPLKGLLEKVFERVTGRTLHKRFSPRVNGYGTREDFQLSRDLQLTKDQSEVSYHSAVRSIQRPSGALGHRRSDDGGEPDFIDDGRPKSSRVCYVKMEYEVSYEQR